MEFTTTDITVESNYTRGSIYGPNYGFEFTLSQFQIQAIEGILAGHNVLVTAPTGSGKTLPAEFCIREMVLQRRKKVIYCSPIKALSNQKFYEFSQKYADMGIQFGLITGDIKTNPNADVIIMTTEILYNHLSRGPSGVTSSNSSTCGGLQFQMNLEEELGAVIFDEIHYINDPDRGKVWEGCIMMLPATVQIVGLSATLAQPQKFADWIHTARPDKQIVLCQTSHRQVPLSHYVYLAHSEALYKKKTEPKQNSMAVGGRNGQRMGGQAKGQRMEGTYTDKPVIDSVLAKEIRDSTNKLLPLQDAHGKFQDTTYRSAIKVKDTYRKQQVSVPRKHVLNSLMAHLRDQEMIPAIAFVFSRKQVETCAHDITVNLLEDDSKVPYIARRECEQIVRKLPNYEEYLRLPEYESLVKLLEKGIGIHHAGMLPILREIVELFISKRYVKLLCCTETFAIGLDCPIRTAIFTNIYKYTNDGGSSVPRLLHAHEYSQASGRAGRRGLDKFGYVVHCANLFDIPTATEYRSMMSGTPPTLSSKFKINYSWILNLIRSLHFVPGFTPSEVAERLQGGKRQSRFWTQGYRSTTAPLVVKSGNSIDLHDAIQRSMFYEELQATIRGQEICISHTKHRLATQQHICDTLTTPMDACLTYLSYMSPESTEFASKKRKADNERGGAALLATWPDTLISDVAAVNRLHTIQFDVDREQRYLDSMQTCISDQTDGIIRILMDKQFVTLTECGGGQKTLTECGGGQKTLTDRGRMAAAIAEIHPLALVDVLEHTGFFWEYDVTEIIGWLAMYTDIKIQTGTNNRLGGDDRTKMGEDLYGIYDFVMERYHEYHELEQHADLNTGIAYHGVVQTVLVLPMMEWSNLTTELECKKFVQVRLVDLCISLGDFSKSVLKISAVAKELIAMCEVRGESALEFQSKLSYIDAHMLKYVIMNQSLYV
jgi:hypothetical protein